MQCVICRQSAFSRFWCSQIRVPQLHNRTVLAFAELKAKAAGDVGLTCQVVHLVPAFGVAATPPNVAMCAVHPASPPDEARLARILSGNIIRLNRFGHAQPRPRNLACSDELNDG